ncbi:MAG: response regulator [Candidatus Brocadiaceae bacterium]|nr:response regulator [Candidatus Brocadiaceae bacterium]
MDDIENNLLLLEELLTEEGYNIESAVNGKDALEKLHAGKGFDLIISDILMPVMDGFMFCDNVKKDEQLRNVPFIFSSASFVGEKDEELAIKLGAKRFIRMPYEKEEILKVVQGLLKDVDDSKTVTHGSCLEDDKEVHKLYNERLVEKLEKKVLDLGHEISERKKAEEMLRESEEKYRAIFEIPRVGMAMCKMDGTLIECNQAYLDIIGYTKEEALLLSYWDFTPTEYAENETKQLYFLKEAGQYGPYEKEYIRKDGSRVPVLLNGVIINGDDGGNYIWSIVQDITEYKKMEQALLKSEKLKSLGMLAAGVSHELNNILAIISGNVQLLKETYKGDEELRESLCTMMKAIDDGTNISSRMLKFTKTENGVDKLVAFDIRDLIIQSIDFTSPRWKNEAQANGIDYQINKDGMKSVSSIMCNPSELREVFINIINNALDAMPDGGNISFSTWSGENTVFVSIADTGAGMSEETKRCIFDHFFTTKKALGTGLGMSLAYGIISRHGGNIEVESDVGKGTKFTLQFPTTNERPSLITTHESEQKLNKKNLRILVIDDEDALCNVLERFFLRFGNKVKTVNNGTDAINIVKSEDFDLVLCDLAMPDIFGCDVIEAINKLEKIQKIGIITGRGGEIKPMEEGMNVDFVLKKPFNLTELAKQINGLKF